MSLFNRASSSSDSSQKTSTTNTSTNTNVQGGSGGISIGSISSQGGNSSGGFGKGGGGGGNVQINTLDAGAISKATSLAQSSLDAAQAINGSSLSLAQSLASKVVSFASDTNRLVADNSLNSVQAVSDFGSSAFSEIDKALQTTVATNAQAFDTVARSQSTNVALSDLSQNTLKYGVIAIALLVGGLVLFGMVKK